MNKETLDYRVSRNKTSKETFVSLSAATRFAETIGFMFDYRKGHFVVKRAGRVLARCTINGMIDLTRRHKQLMKHGE